MHIRSKMNSLPLSKQEMALISVTMVWGATFLLIHIAMNYSGPMFFVGVRFMSAGLLACLLFAKQLKGLTLMDLGAGAAIGLMIFAGYSLQSYGLQTINSSTSAFLTAVYVPMVPFLQWAVFRKRPSVMAFIGVGLAFIGLILLAGPDAIKVGLGPGEIATLISTLPVAGEIILISLFASKVKLGRVTVVQLLVAGALAFIAMPVTGESVPEFSWVWLVIGVSLGAASCGIQATMNWAQKSISPTRATIIYTGEPVWAGIIGRIAGDRLPFAAVIGAVLIVVSVLVSELQLGKNHPKGKLREVDPQPVDTEHV